MLVRSPEGQLTTYSGLGVLAGRCPTAPICACKRESRSHGWCRDERANAGRDGSCVQCTVAPIPRQVTIILHVDNQPILRRKMICHLPYATCSLNPCRAFKVVNSAHGSLCPPETNYLSPICWVHSRLGQLRDIIGIYSELPVFAAKS